MKELQLMYQIQKGCQCKEFDIVAIVFHYMIRDVNLALFLLLLIWINGVQSIHSSFFIVMCCNVSEICNGFLKSQINRDRPYNNNNHFQNVHFILFTEPDSSFPSSHAQILATLSTAMCLFYYETSSLWFHFTSFALLVFFNICCGFSRIYSGVHYPSDVIAGWILGLFIPTIMYIFQESIVHTMIHIQWYHQLLWIIPYELLISLSIWNNFSRIHSYDMPFYTLVGMICGYQTIFTFIPDLPEVSFVMYISDLIIIMCFVLITSHKKWYYLCIAIYIFMGYHAITLGLQIS